MVLETWGVNWFVGVSPPVDDEIMEKLAFGAMEGWNIQNDDPNSTVFRKWATELIAVNAAEDIIAELETIDDVTTIRDFTVTHMHNRVSPFPDSPSYY